MFSRAVRFLGVLVVASLVPPSASAQLSTPAPNITADNERWYLSGAPINLGGVIYYPSGPTTHFNRNEMVFTGVFERVPVYKRTTEEPGSVIYVPLAGGLVRPYERRRSGDLAGTVGSTVPSFPVVLPAAEVSQAQGPSFFGTPTPVIPRPVGTTGFLYGTAVIEPEPAATDASVPQPVGTAGVDMMPSITGTTALRAGPARVETIQRPVGLNGVFVEFEGARWFASGPAIELASRPLTKVGDYQGFPVYQEPDRPERIFVAALPGEPVLVIPYERREGR